MKPLALAVMALFFTSPVVAQEAPTPPPATPSTAGAPDNASSSSATPAPRKSKDKPIPSFLILGTVFNERALSFPGVQVRIRRAGEKKFCWETYTNSRGEFAVRLPPGYNYEVVTHVKKYQDQTKTVDSKVDVQQRLSIKLEPVGQPKSGAKP